MKSIFFYIILILTMRRLPLIFFSFLLVILNMTGPLLAQTTLSTTSYYPLPSNTYERFRLVPIAQQTNTPCVIGTFYTNRDDGNRLYYCRNSGTSDPTGKWTPMPEVWAEQKTSLLNNIFLSDESNPLAKKVGIGTDSPAFKLTLENNAGILAEGTFGSGADYSALSTGAYFIWWPKKAALRAGTVSPQTIGASTRIPWDPDLIGNYSVAFGSNSLATATGSAVTSGANNRTGESSSCGPYSTVAGGESNQINIGKEYLVIGGGQSHQLGGDLYSGLSCSTQGASYEVIGGGKGYMLGKDFSTVIGGEGGAYPSSVTQLGAFASIGGGLMPAQNYDTITYLTALGGNGHALASNYGAIGGGQGHSLAGNYSYIGGGFSNSTTGDYAVVAGGQYNSAAAYATVLGGGDTNPSFPNKASGPYSVILGGRRIECSGSHSSCGGGYYNRADAHYSFIGGGYNNQITGTGTNSAISSGNQNFTAGQNSFVGGGLQNRANGNFSTAPGGFRNKADGNYSLAAGRNMTVSSYNTFAFGAPSSVVNINSPDSFIIYGTASGPNTLVGIGQTSPSQRLHVTDGNIRVDGSLIIDNPVGSGSSTALVRDISGVLGFDLAERFPTSEAVEAGDVVVIDTNSDKIILRRSSQAHDKKIIGVVSSAPGMILSSENLEMNSGGQPAESPSAPVALSGRVPCKVSLENGPISRGDLLTSSSLAGHAMRAGTNNSFGTIIGKALEPFPNTNTGETQNSKDSGMIMIMVTLQ